MSPPSMHEVMAGQARELQAQVNAQGMGERRQPWALREVAIELGQQAAAADVFRIILEELVRHRTTSPRVKALQAAAVEALNAHPARAIK